MPDPKLTLFGGRSVNDLPRTTESPLAQPAGVSFSRLPEVTVYKPNAPGVRRLAQAMTERGIDGADFLSRYNAEATKGPAYAREMAMKIDRVAADFGIDPNNLWSMPEEAKPARQSAAPVAPPKAGDSPAEPAAVAKPAEKPAEEIEWDGIGDVFSSFKGWVTSGLKAGANRVPDFFPGLLREGAVASEMLGALAKINPVVASLTGGPSGADYIKIFGSGLGTAKMALSILDPATGRKLDDFAPTPKMNAVSAKLGDWADNTGKFMEDYKFALPALRKNTFRDDDGNWNVDGEAIAQAIGGAGGDLAIMAATRRIPTMGLGGTGRLSGIANSLLRSPERVGQGLGNTAARMMGVVGSAEGGVSVGRLGTALRNAEAVGNTLLATELKTARNAAQRTIGYMSSLAPQLESTYQSALEATGDKDYALSFASVIAPMVAAMDSFTGAGGLVNRSGRSALSREAVAAALTGLPQELGEASFGMAAKRAATTFAGKLGKVALESGEEAGTETLQEVGSMTAEYASDRMRGKDEFGANAQDWVSRIGTSLIAGLAMGGAMGAAVHRSGEYQPTAFQALHEAYTADGDEGLTQQYRQFAEYLTKQTGMTDVERTQLDQNLRQMSSVITSMRNPYANSPAQKKAMAQAAYSIYDLHYRRIPAAQNVRQELEDKIAALQGDNPVRLATNTDGMIERFEGRPVSEADGTPQGDRLDPAVAEFERTKLEALLPFQQQRINYLHETNEKQKGLIAGSTTSATPSRRVKWEDGYELIGSIKPGDLVTEKKPSKTPFTGRVIGYSADGQQAKLEVIYDDPTQLAPIGGRMVPIQDIKVTIPGEATNGPAWAATPQEQMSAMEPVPEGFVPAAGDSVLFADETEPVTIVNVKQEEDGITYAVVEAADPDEPQIWVPLTGDEAVAIEGLYNPAAAEAAADAQEKRTRIAAALEQAAKSVPPNVVKLYNSWSPDQVEQRYHQLMGTGVKEDEQRAEYLSLLMQSKGRPAPDADMIGDEDTSIVERISDIEYSEIASTGIVPDAVINRLAFDVATFGVDGLTERQLELWKNFDLPENAEEGKRFHAAIRQLWLNQAATAATMARPVTLADDDFDGVERISESQLEEIAVTGFVSNEIMEQLAKDFFVTNSTRSLTANQELVYDQIFAGEESADEQVRFDAAMRDLWQEEAIRRNTRPSSLTEIPDDRNHLPRVLSDERVAEILKGRHKPLTLAEVDGLITASESDYPHPADAAILSWMMEDGKENGRALTQFLDRMWIQSNILPEAVMNEIAYAYMAGDAATTRGMTMLDWLIGEGNTQLLGELDNHIALIKKNEAIQEQVNRTESESNGVNPSDSAGDEGPAQSAEGADTPAANETTGDGQAEPATTDGGPAPAADAGSDGSPAGAQTATGQATGLPVGPANQAAPEGLDPNEDPPTEEDPDEDEDDDDVAPSPERVILMGLKGDITPARAAKVLVNMKTSAAKDLLESMVTKGQAVRAGDGIYRSATAVQEVVIKPVEFPAKPDIKAPTQVLAHRLSIGWPKEGGIATVKWNGKVIASVTVDKESKLMSIAEAPFAVKGVGLEAAEMKQVIAVAKNVQINADHEVAIQRAQAAYDVKYARAVAKQAEMDRRAAEAEETTLDTATGIDTDTDEDLLEEGPEVKGKAAKPAADPTSVWWLSEQDGHRYDGKIISRNKNEVVVQYLGRSKNLTTIARSIESLTSTVTGKKLTGKQVTEMKIKKPKDVDAVSVKVNDLMPFKDRRIFVVGPDGKPYVGYPVFSEGKPVVDKDGFSITLAVRSKDSNGRSNGIIPGKRVVQLPLGTKFSSPLESQLERQVGIATGLAQAQGSGPVIGQVAVRALVDRLSKAFPRIRTSIFDEAQADAADMGTDLGRVRDGQVLLNADRATGDSPIHEFAHILNTITKTYFPNVYSVAEDMIRGSVYETMVRESGAYTELDDAGVLEEAIAQAIGERGSRLLGMNKVGRFVSWMGLITRRIGEKLGMNLSPETKLNDFLDTQARKLLSGKVQSDITSEQLAQLDPTQRSQKAPPVVLPDVMDEAYLRANVPGATGAGREAVGAYKVRLDANGEPEIVLPDTAAESNAIKEADAKLTGNWARLARWFGTRQEPRMIAKLLFGNSIEGREFMDMVQHQQGEASALGVEQVAHFNELWQSLKHGSAFRNHTPTQQITYQQMNITDGDGNAQVIEVPQDALMKLAAMYRSAIEQYGFVDREHRQKADAGEDWAMKIAIPDTNNPDRKMIVSLDKEELRRIEQLVFEDDAEMAEIMAKWTEYSEKAFPVIDRVKTLVTGKPLRKSEFYYPLSSFRESDGSLSKGRDRTVDDASILQEREGPPDIFDLSSGMVSDVYRYHRAAHAYVEGAPVWHNLDGLLKRQSETITNSKNTHSMLKPITKLRDRLALEITAMDEELDVTVPLLRKLTPGAIIQLATVSRFAFNIAIPIKQTTSFVAALDGGIIDTKYLAPKIGTYLSDIGKCYLLTFRGDRAGWYWNEDTKFDQRQGVLRALHEQGNRWASILLERVQTSVHPDVNNADWLAGEGSNGMVEGIASGMREYGLAASRRADGAVIYTFFDAAMEQVADQHPELSAEQQAEMACQLAVRQLYSVNQTLSRTDKSASQLNSDPIRQIVNLYQSQSIKIMNTVMERAIDVDLAEEGEDRKKAKWQFKKTLVLNGLITPMLTAGIDYMVQAIRNLPMDDEEEEKTDEELAKAWTGRIVESMLTQVPGGWGAVTASMVNGLAQNHAARPMFPSFFETPQAVLDASIGAVSLFKKEYRDEDAFNKEVVKVASSFIRAVGPATGLIPTEFARQAANALTLTLPAEKPKRPPRENPSGFEYATDGLFGQ